MELKHVQILLIDDDKDYQLVFEALLSQVKQTAMTFHLDYADTIEKGLERLTKGGIDIIFLNPFLPETKGLEALNKLQPVISDVPVVILTSLHDDTTALETVGEGAQDYFLKDEIDVKRLSRVIRFGIERKHSNESLRQLASIVESSDDAVISQTLDGTIVNWNPGAERIYGYSASEAKGRPISILLSSERPFEMKEILETIKRGEPIKHYETICIRKDGTPIDVLMNISPIRNPAGKVTGISAITRDIRERKMSEKIIQELAKVKSEFVSMVSHELRTPLTIVREGTALIRDQVLGPVTEKQAEMLGDILDNVDRLTSIINGLLNFSRVEAGRMEIKKSAVDVAPVIKKLVKDFQLKAKAKGIELTADLPADLRLVDADKDKIIQVLMNLVGNAVKFTGKSGKVLVRAKNNGEFVEISVTDTGRGIAKEDLPRLFQKFQQFRRVEGPGEKGTGLGLAISKKIIDLHGGSIWAESVYEKGSTFYFTIPRHNKT